jgi:hypothetical protein
MEKNCHAAGPRESLASKFQAPATRKSITAVVGLRTAAALGLWLVIGLELAQFGRLTVAEIRLHAAARAAMEDALLPRTCENAVRERALGTLQGGPLAVQLHGLEFTIDRLKPEGRTTAHRGQEVKIVLEGGLIASWSILARLGVLPEDGPLLAAATRFAP